MKHCVIYARTASERQVTHKNDSLHYQVEEIKKQAQINRCDVDEVFMEYGAGTDLNRPVFNKMLKMVKQSDVDAILCTDVTRISRNYAGWKKFCDFLKETGVKLITL